jgi:propionyl-CoA synthetase
VAATDPLYILYTSGTTGMPKGVVRDNGGHAVALKWSMEHVYGVRPGEVFWAASDIGWVVGHSYIVYGPLLHGCTTVMYEGKPVGTPDPGEFWRVIEQHGVRVLFTAPTPSGRSNGKIPTANSSGSTTSPACARSFSPASDSTPTPITGPVVCWSGR